MEKENCPVCLNNSFENLIDYGLVPQSGVYLSTPDEECRKLRLAFEYCIKCAFIRQKSFENLHNYAEEKERTWQKLSDYSYEVIQSFHERGIKNNELIIEVGGGDGLFLDGVSESGFSNLLEIEPSVSSSNICKSKGYKVENVYFNDKEADRIKEKYGSASIVVCRHVLEHILNPFNFLISMKKLLKDNGFLFLEVPDAGDIIYNLRTYEFWDEHLNYFTFDNLKMLVSRAGFKVEKYSIKPYFGEKAIHLWCSINPEENKLHKFNQKDIDACKNFEERCKFFYENIRSKIKNSKKPVVGIGAAHKQTNTLIFSEIGEYISYLIDDDKYKTNKYVCAPKPIPIISTEQFLKEKFSGTIIRTAYGFDNWMDKICNAVNAEVIDLYKET